MTLFPFHHAWPSFYNPWTGTIAMWPGQAPSASGPSALALLTAPHYGMPPTPPYGVPVVPQAPPPLLPPRTPTSTTWSPPAGGWDNASLAAAFSTMAMTPPSSDWVIDSSASYHTTPTVGTLSRSHPPFPLTHPRSSLEMFHSASHLSRCLGSPWAVLPQRCSRSSPHHSQSSFCPSIHH